VVFVVFKPNKWSTGQRSGLSPFSNIFGLLQFSYIFRVFASACFCLALGGKLHLMKSISIGFEVLNLPSKGLAAIVPPSTYELPGYEWASG